MTIIPLSTITLEEPVTVPLKRLPHGQDLPLPSYGTALSAGLDLYAAVERELILAPGEWHPIPTGISIALPAGHEGQIRSRSGLAAKHGVVVLNAPGTVDADYRGELMVLLINHGKEPFIVTRGLRLAQLVISEVVTIAWEEKDSLEETDRGEGRFGSTGIQ